MATHPDRRAALRPIGSNRSFKLHQLQGRTPRRLKVLSMHDDDALFTAHDYRHLQSAEYLPAETAQHACMNLPAEAFTFWRLEQRLEVVDGARKPLRLLGAARLGVWVACKDQIGARTTEQRLRRHTNRNAYSPSPHACAISRRYAHVRRDLSNTALVIRACN
eukprot:6189714-Pleurochrysis_carterae.AAC.1